MATKAAAKKKDKKPEPEKSFDFDVEKFKSATFTERTAEIPVVNSDMASFFPKGTKPTLLVRGLTSLELARADAEVQINREARDDANISNLGAEAIEALRVLLRTHLDKDTPDAHVKMLHLVHMGLIKPKLTYDQVMKVSDVFPVEFRMAFIKINELTGRGKDFVGKPKDSGQTLES
jgi:hypothetical protein